MKGHYLVLLAVTAGALGAAAGSDKPNPQSPSPVQVAPPMARPNSANPMDDFAGLDLTEDQKVQIRKVRLEGEARRNIIVNDPKLNADQKAALLQGYMRSEYREMYELLTPEQKAEVRKKIAARREQAHRQSPGRPPSRPN
jgi:Spy/CpxP family protein refolding chaperone